MVTGIGETKPLFRVQMAETKSTPVPAPSGDQSDEKGLNELPAACVTDAAGKEVAWLIKVKDGLKPHKLGNVMMGSSFQILQRSPDSPGVDNAFVRATVTRYPLISTPDIGVSVFDVDGKYTHSGQWFTVKDKSGAGGTAGSKVPERAAANAVTQLLQKLASLLGLPSGPKRRALAAWTPKRGCIGALLVAHGHRFHCLLPYRRNDVRQDREQQVQHPVRRGRRRCIRCLRLDCAKSPPGRRHSYLCRCDRRIHTE